MTKYETIQMKTSNLISFKSTMKNKYGRKQPNPTIELQAHVTGQAHKECEGVKHVLKFFFSKILKFL